MYLLGHLEGEALYLRRVRRQVLTRCRAICETEKQETHIVFKRHDFDLAMNSDDKTRYKRYRMLKIYSTSRRCIMERISRAGTYALKTLPYEPFPINSRNSYFGISSPFRRSFSWIAFSWSLAILMAATLWRESSLPTAKVGPRN